METLIPLDEAERNFSDLLKRVVNGKETVLLTAEGTVVGRIVPELVAKELEPVNAVPEKEGVSERLFAEMWKSLPHLSAEEAEALEQDLKEFRRDWNRSRVPEDPWERWG